MWLSPNALWVQVLHFSNVLYWVKSLFWDSATDSWSYELISIKCMFILITWFPHLRTCLLLWVIQAMVLEHPQSSMVLWHPRVREIMKSLKKASLCSLDTFITSGSKSVQFSLPSPAVDQSWAGILGSLVDATLRGGHGKETSWAQQCKDRGCIGLWSIEQDGSK